MVRFHLSFYGFVDREFQQLFIYQQYMEPLFHTSIVYSAFLLHNNDSNDIY